MASPDDSGKGSRHSHLPVTPAQAQHEAFPEAWFASLEIGGQDRDQQSALQQQTTQDATPAGVQPAIPDRLSDSGDQAFEVLEFLKDLAGPYLAWPTEEQFEFTVYEPSWNQLIINPEFRECVEM